MRCRRPSRRPDRRAYFPSWPYFPSRHSCRLLRSFRRLRLQSVAVIIEEPPQQGHVGISRALVYVDRLCPYSVRVPYCRAW